MSVRYIVGMKPDTASFIELYRSSTLASYRPLDDPRAVQQMIEHANLLLTAWDGELLVGLARTLTDISYIAYLADLVVRDTHQRRGIGIELMRRTQQQLGYRAKIVLLAAPEAETYYQRAGFRNFPSTWLLGAREELVGGSSGS